MEVGKLKHKIRACFGGFRCSINKRKKKTRIAIHWRSQIEFNALYKFNLASNCLWLSPSSLIARVIIYLLSYPFWTSTGDKSSLWDVWLVESTTGLFESLFNCMKSPLVFFLTRRNATLLTQVLFWDWKHLSLFFCFKSTSVQWMLGHHLSINLSPPVVERCPHHLNTCVLPCAWCFLVCEVRSHIVDTKIQRIAPVSWNIIQRSHRNKY